MLNDAGLVLVFTWSHPTLVLPLFQPPKVLVLVHWSFSWSV